ncbi:MAG: PRC-barrel domain-containing protein [Nitrospira sp.]
MKIHNLLHYMTAVTVMVIVPHWVFAEGDLKPKPPKSSVEKQATDMTGGQPGTVEEYDVVPVRRGALVDEKGGALDQVVKNTKGETLGTIEKLLKDTKTGKVEYAVLEVEGTKHQLPLQWSQFKQSGGQLTLNATKEELQPSTNATQATDKSPDTSTYMEEINKVRGQPKPQGVAPDGGGTDRPAAVGPMGESEVGGAGPSGTRTLPPGGAPGYEGDHPSSKR